MVISTNAFQILVTMEVVAQTSSTDSRVTVLMDLTELGVNTTSTNASPIHVETVEPVMIM